jgi:polysaccharide export outer membrane protein
MKYAIVGVLVGGAFAVSNLFAAASATAQAVTAVPAERAAGDGAAAEAYRIGPEDILQISVWKNEPRSRTVAVRPDGRISLPLVNDVQAAGLTALELRQVLTRGLSGYIPSPEVSVMVSEIRSIKVSVMGEVAKPGRFELKSWATVLDVLAMAGGFTQFASRSRILVLRQEGGAMKRIPFNYNKVVSDQENFQVRNGDVVLVP